MTPDKTTYSRPGSSPVCLSVAQGDTGTRSLIIQILLAGFLLLTITSCATPTQETSSAFPIDYVDPMIGAVAKTKYFGRTFPGSTLPYALVKLGPDTYTGGDIASGYSLSTTPWKDSVLST